MATHKKKQDKSRKKSGAKKVAKKTAGGAKYSGPSAIGFTKSAGGSVLIPEPRAKSESGVVAASKLQKGISKARDQISGVLQELLEATRDGYEVTEIELSASFSSDGKFLGFGVGGEMSITFKVRPKDEA